MNIKLDALRTLRHFLVTHEEEITNHLDMTVFQTANADTLLYDPECGAAACLVGWSAFIPAFNHIPAPSSLAELKEWWRYSKQVYGICPKTLNGCVVEEEEWVLWGYLFGSDNSNFLDDAIERIDHVLDGTYKEYI